MEVTVLSYNVLSSFVCNPKEYPYCKKKHLDAAKRLNKLKTSVCKPMMKRRAIIALQELSINWKASMLTFFQQNNYTMVASESSIGKHFAYAFAFPNDVFELNKLCLEYPFKLKEAFVDDGTKPSRPIPSSKLPISLLIALFCGICCMYTYYFEEISSDIWFGAFVTSLFSLIGEIYMRNPQADFKILRNPYYNFDDVRPALKKHEGFQLPIALLQHRKSGKQFWFATTHMPCKFWNEPLMFSFGALTMKTMESVNKKKLPMLLTGDFNMKPQSPFYEHVVKGAILKDHKHYPKSLKANLKLQHSWISAYAEINGREPDFTNYCELQKQNGKLFMECLDYFFVGNGFVVKSVKNLPSKKDFGERKIPDATGISDHLSISCILSFE